MGMTRHRGRTRISNLLDCVAVLSETLLVGSLDGHDDLTQALQREGRAGG
jgi:hypothetical protein